MEIRTVPVPIDHYEIHYVTDIPFEKRYDYLPLSHLFQIDDDGGDGDEEEEDGVDDDDDDEEDGDDDDGEEEDGDGDDESVDDDDHRDDEIRHRWRQRDGGWRHVPFRLILTLTNVPDATASLR